MILTSLPPLSCQSPMPRSKRQTLLPWAASVPGAESKKTQVYHVYPTRAARTCILWAFSLFCFALEFILRLAFSLFVYHRCHIAFLVRDVISLFPLGAVRFVSFSPLPFRSVQRANMYPLGVFFVWVWHRSHIAFLGRDIISLGGRVAEINQSTNQPYLFCLVSKSCSSPRGGLQGRKWKASKQIPVRNRR